MKKLFKYIVRKVDEKVSNSIKEIKETVKAIKEVSNDIESKKFISNVFIGSGVVMIGAGVGVIVVGLLTKADMVIK